MIYKQKNVELIGRRTFFFAWVVIGVLATFSYQTLFMILFRILSPDMSNAEVGNSLLVIVAFVVFSGAGFLQQYIIY
jgi:hypothetical protein